MKCCFNSVGNRQDFHSWTEGFKLGENFSTKVGEQFGIDAMVVLAAQNYENVKDTRSCFNNILEIYDVKEGGKYDEIHEIYTTLDMYILADLVWMSSSSALAVFHSEYGANTALNIRCPLFKSRKLQDGSDLAITFAVDLAWPTNGPNAFSIQVDELPPWEPILKPSEIYRKFPSNPKQNCKTTINRPGFTPKLQDIPEEPEEVFESQTITDADSNLVIENPYYYL